MPLDDGATGSAADLDPDALVCTADSGWSRCRLLLDEVRVRHPHAVRIVLMEAGDNARAVDALERRLAETGTKAKLNRELADFLELDAPPQRLNAKETPVPYHPALWGTHRPTASSVANSLRQLLEL